MKKLHYFALGSALCLGSTQAQAQQDGQKRVRPTDAIPSTLDRGPEIATSLTVPDRGPELQRPMLPQRAAADATQTSQSGMSLTVDHSRIYWDQNTKGETWVRGKDYKASFSKSGMKFVPYLGHEVPRNFPVEFKLDSVKVGEKFLELTPEAQVQRTDSRMVLDRGPVEVMYDVELSGVEQLFQLPEIDGAQDITLRIDLATDLNVEPHNGGWRFGNQYGGVDYGAALAIDEAGNTLNLPTQYTGNAFEIVIPADFVASATGAILVDPLVTTFDVDTVGGFFLSDPDVAYGPAEDRYLVVYQEQFSGGDWDIYTRVVEAASGADALISGYAELGNDNWTIPRVAHNFNSGKFMIVAQSADATTGDTSIKARMRTAADNVFEPEFTISGPIGSSQPINPDVGGDNINLSASYFHVVFERDYTTDSDIWYARYNSSGTEVTAPASLDSDLDHDLIQPRISKGQGSPGADEISEIVWISEPLTGSAPATIQARRVSWTGAALGSQFQVTSSPAGFFEVEVSDSIPTSDPGTGEDYYVVTVDDNQFSVENGLILCSGETVHDEIQIYRSEHDVAPVDQDDPVIATTEDSWIVAYGDYQAPDWEIWNSVFQPVDGKLALSEPPFLVDTIDAPGGNLTTLQVSSIYSGGATMFTSEAMNVFTNDVSPDRNILGALVFEDSANAAGYQYCYGEPNSTGTGALILATGDNTTTGLKEMRTVNMPAGEFCYLLTGTMSGLIQNPGGADGDLCLGGNFGRYNLIPEIGNTGVDGTFDFTVDPQAIRTNTGDVVGMVGQTWYFQTWFRDTPAGSGSSNFSNGVAIPLQ